MRSLTLLLKAGCSELYIEAILKATRRARHMDRMSSSLSAGMTGAAGRGAGLSGLSSGTSARSADMVHLYLSKTGLIILSPGGNVMLRAGDSRGDSGGPAAVMPSPREVRC